LIKQQKLEDLILEKVPGGVTDSRGFYSLKCQCCNDYKVRAGFKFDGLQSGFNCWNCGTSARYEEFSGKISRKMRTILNAFGIDDTEISSVVNSSFFIEKKDEKITLTALAKINTTTPTVKLPEKTFQIGNCPEFIDYQIKLVEYLESRKVDVNKFPFYFSLEDRFIDRVIIPYYRGGKLIYWQARSIHDHEKKRYDNAPVGREAVLFNYDALNSYSAEPLFVSEGVFDAMMFNGVATLGSKLTLAQLELLHKSNRKLVFVIDKDENGRHLAEKVLREGWQIAFVPNGSKDLNHCVVKHGRTWTAWQLMKNLPKDADSAQLAININCT
jgi:hypothetical protein